MEVLITTLASSVVVFVVTTVLAKSREQRLERLILQLRHRIGYLEKTSQIGWPLPYWVKDRYGVMLSCSDAYETVFLHPRRKTKDDYIGKRDEEIWDESVAKEFRNNDIAVMKSGKNQDFIEMVPNTLGILEPWLVTKFPVKFNNVTIGVAGTATSLKNIDLLKQSIGV